MKSRIVQAIILIALFITGVILFSGGGSSTVEQTDYYLPPSP